ncbi:MAG: ABC transporter permease subunit [Beijerinckiaceae bacterium]|jgi:putative spermidine/putrescine transport system permease protein|nr:ABC transporter permease subunit [Beijerinckiaceae bacterium]
MRRRLPFMLALSLTLLTAMFLVVPALMSMLAGVTSVYARGISSGLTTEWIIEVWRLYADTIWRSILIALLTLLATLLIGVPVAYAFVVNPSRFTRILDEIMTLPLAVPGLAVALAMLQLYGGFTDFRRSSLFIVAGHVVFTLPFMVRAVAATLSAVDIRTLEEGAASLGARPLRRFLDIVVPAAMPGILAGSLMVVTLSIGEFNLTWMLHTPLTKTLPVGLADSYASMRLEIASAYTLVFFIMIMPLLIAMQIAARANAGKEALP